MYDYSASSSSPPPSPQKHQHASARRSHSPIPHISTLLPHNHHHSQYSPATRAADISRLLDPAYASGSSSGSSTMASPTHHHKHGQTRAYVDRNGDLHDPDYRDFPVLPPSARAGHANRRRRASHTAGATRSRSASRHREPYSAYAISRPEWERDWSTEIEDDDDDLEEEQESQSHYSPFASPRRSATVHTSHGYHTYAPYSRFVGEPQPVSSSPAGSLDDAQTFQMHDSPLQESPFMTEESDVFPAEIKKKSRRSSGHSGILRRVSRKTESAAHESVVDEESEKSDAEHQQQRFSMDGDNVPSCTDSLRRQWAATVLRVRFSVFHAKRRLSLRRRSTT